MGRVPSRGSDQFVVRLPNGMRDRIADAARGAGRSMNAEIVHRLEDSFHPQPTTPHIQPWFVAMYTGGLFASHLAMLIADYLPHAPPDRRAPLEALRESALHYMKRANAAVDTANEAGLDAVALVPVVPDIPPA